MATFLKLLNDTSKEIVKNAYGRRNQADDFRIKEYSAAVRIQSWYRRLRIQHYVRYLHHCAVVIQKTWRGYIGRKFCRVRVRNLVMIMRMNFYNALAVRIQRRWRGYYVRKYVHNFYARKRYIEALEIKNHIIVKELKEFKEEMEMEAKRREKERLEKEMQIMAIKNHYLISTKQIPGIYNSPFKDFPDEMEMRLRSVRHFPQRLVKKKSEIKVTAGEEPASYKPHPPTGGFPPITNKNNLGPFKSPEEVRLQRSKPFDKTLRVATDYNSVALERERMKQREWEKRIHDVPFVPFSKIRVKYQQLMHTQSTYNFGKVGEEFFLRREEPEKNISRQRMQNVVSPIPLFDKFGKTYSKGALLLH